MARSKYGSRKVVRDGMTFDSVKEYNRWCELKLLERAGKIKNLQRQVKFILLPAQYEKVFDAKRRRWKDRCVERESSYVADFTYLSPVDDAWEIIVEDSKGFRTADYILKRKMMLYFHGIKIKET